MHVSSRACLGPPGAPVNAELLKRVGFTNHAIARFAERAALGSDSRTVVEPIVRSLLRHHGQVVAERPVWARSRHQADLFIQLEEWMLFIGVQDRGRPGRYLIVTVVNGPAGNNWRMAWRRGYVSVAPPMPNVRAQARVLASAARALGDRRPGEPLLEAIRRTHRARAASWQADYDRALLERWRNGAV